MHWSRSGIRPVVFGLACCVALGGTSAHDGRVAVIVELFTSEGCSSCPPADAVLAKLERTQPVNDVRIIPLSEHVDYWNNLGWVDPFSSPQFRARQNDFAQVFGVESVYTPQMVVNGFVEFVGDDLNRATTEIQRVAQQPSATVQLRTTRNSNNSDMVDLMVRVRDIPSIKLPPKGSVAPLDVFLAVTEDNVQSDVAHGENAGRRLRHAAVVRSFGVIGSIDPRDKPELALRPTLKLPGSWKRQDLHAVVFVQEHATRRIIGSQIVDLD